MDTTYIFLYGLGSYCPPREGSCPTVDTLLSHPLTTSQLYIKKVCNNPPLDSFVIKNLQNLKNWGKIESGTHIGTGRGGGPMGGFG